MTLGEILKVENLQFSYRQRPAVKGVSFSVMEGQVFGLLGANGAGKTTTLSCLSGLLSNWTGSIRYRDTPFQPAKSVSDRMKIGVVPQDLAIYENLTGRENLELFAELSLVPRSKRKEQVDRMLMFSGLESRSHDLVKLYSGGMKRRLNLVAGLVHSPAILLLDEPTVGVDPQSRNHLFESILSLKDAGMSMIYTTHYMEEAQRLCDQIAIMHEGVIVAKGTPKELAISIGDETANLERVFLHLTGRNLRDE